MAASGPEFQSIGPDLGETVGCIGGGEPAPVHLVRLYTEIPEEEEPVCTSVSCEVGVGEDEQDQAVNLRVTASERQGTRAWESPRGLAPWAGQSACTGSPSQPGKGPTHAPQGLVPAQNWQTLLCKDTKVGRLKIDRCFWPGLTSSYPGEQAQPSLLRIEAVTSETFQGKLKWASRLS
ncbi:hypothetical protein P7K49_034002, partial [Saguinus oedipus]